MTRVRLCGVDCVGCCVWKDISPSRVTWRTRIITPFPHLSAYHPLQHVYTVRWIFSVKLINYILIFPTMMIRAHLENIAGSSVNHRYSNFLQWNLILSWILSFTK